MKIALIGYGKMGKLLEIKATEQSHTICKILDNHNWNPEDLEESDIAIDFSSPESVVENIHKSFKSNTPIVVGTTGWYDHFEKVKMWCKEYDGSILPASNFSLGVNIFFEINRKLSKLMNKQKSYNVKINEVHHTEKIDSPSGTAITTAEILIKELDKYSKWALDSSLDDDNLPIIASRESGIPGNHEVVYQSSTDELTLSHKAKNRDGFASGAIIAAEFLIDKKGLFTMKDIIKL